jgi:hypothetical protein
MATHVVTEGQTKAEIRTHFVDFGPDLPAGVTVSSVAATHVPPSGVATVPVVNLALTPIAQLTLGPVGVEGMHRLHCLATLSDGEKIEAILYIAVNS